jgi:hypothetical protein
MIKTTPKYYQRQLFYRGIISVLYVLEYFEYKEMYEECQKIVDAIREQERVLGCTFDTRITRALIEECRGLYKTPISVEEMLGHYEFYAKCILKEILELA